MNNIISILSQMIKDKKVNVRSTINPEIECEIGYARSYYIFELMDGRKIVMFRGNAKQIETEKDVKCVLIQIRKHKRMSWLCNGQPNVNCRELYHQQ